MNPLAALSLTIIASLLALLVVVTVGDFRDSRLRKRRRRR